ncbi:MAG: sigma-70 family RNA polymerase sigma factor [Thermoguttaceae bacterium]|nr:sigma-70 family RNA polymerase sigma factor [Thermoguttaceae bacterium]
MKNDASPGRTIPDDPRELTDEEYIRRELPGAMEDQSSCGLGFDTLCAEGAVPDGGTGDRIDWAEALRKNEEWLRTVIAARVGESQAVGDIFQEVALAAVRQKAPIQDPSKVAPWLYRLAVIQSLLYRRTMGRKRNLLQRYQQRAGEPLDRDPSPGPLQWLLAEERHQMVRDALDQLPEQSRELLLLKYVHDWSYRDMAEKLGVTVTTVQARLHRARGLLRQALARRVDGEDI